MGASPAERAARAHDGYFNRWFADPLYGRGYPADKVAEYRSGKDKLFGFFVGLAMKASKGKANPAQLNEVLKQKLAG